MTSTPQRAPHPDAAYASLPDDTARLYRRLSHTPGPATPQLAATLTDDPPTTPTHIHTLLSAALIHEHDPLADHPRYQLTYPDHAAHLAQHHDTPEDHAATRRRVLDHYLLTALSANLSIQHTPLPLHHYQPTPAEHITFSTQQHAIDWLTDEIIPLAAIASDADTDPEAAAHLALTVDHVMRRRPTPAVNLRQVCGIGLTAARATGEPALIGRLLSALGRAERRNDPIHSLDLHDEAHALLSEHRDPQTAAAVLHERALTLTALSRTDDARAMQQCALIESFECNNHATAALVLIALATDANERELHRDAAVYSGCAQFILDMTIDADLCTLAQAQMQYAYASIKSGNTHRSPRDLDSAVGLLRRAGAPAQAIPALIQLGDLYAETAPETAASYFREAKGIAADAGDAGIVTELDQRIAQIRE